ncbi:MAG: hypothetical protein CM15mV19_1680 [uncultured marine virus]|nr:MAG: hypothetical protein CM15mV19_1680 [uncultured marine virus]
MKNQKVRMELLTSEALAKDLFNLGVFNKEEDEEVNIQTPEDFLARFESEKKKEHKN